MRRSANVFLVALLFGAPAVAVPVVLHHHGRLLDGAEKPVNSPVSLTVTFFGSKDGDDAGWTKTYTVSPFADGVYAIALGQDHDAEDHPALLTAADVAGDKWIAVSIASTKLLPRLHLGSVPNAIHALDADTLGGVEAAAYALKTDVAPDSAKVGGLGLTDLDARFDGKYAPKSGASYAQLFTSLPPSPQAGSLAVTGTVSAARLSGSVEASQLTGTIDEGRLPTTLANTAFTFSNVGNQFTGSGAGLTNLTPASLAAGTANISITGNAATATNGVVTTGSYANPSWITSLSASKLMGPFTPPAVVSTALPAASSANAGQVVYATDTGRLLFSNGTAWLDPRDPPPVTISVASLVPATAALGKNVTVTLTGAGFTSATTVKFGLTPAATVSVVSATQILATTGTALSAAIYDVVVANPTGSPATLAGAFAVQSGLLAHYDMSSISGTTLRDLSGNAYDGTIQGGIQNNAVTGIIGNALNMANTGYVALPQASGVTGNASRTVAIWVKASSGGGYAFGAGTDGSAGQTFNSRFAGDGTMGFMGWANDYDPSGGFNMMNNVWHLAIYTYDGVNVIAYADNVQAWSVAKSLSTTAGGPVIGRHDAMGLYFPGALDEYRYYNRVISAAERAFLFNAGAGR